MTIREHPLAWRWTDPKYAVLPDDVLEKMVPIGVEDSVKLFTKSCHFNGKDGLSTDLFEVDVISTEGISAEAGSAWLWDQQPDAAVNVFLSWQPQSAIRTTWGIFAKYWEEFCYPSSDDLNVWPEDGDWAFLFHHEEEFHFGRCK